MARFLRLEELFVAANSRLVVDAMLVYFQRDMARDMQIVSGVQLCRIFKKLQQCDWLKLLELVKLIAAMHI
ncbi:hypothetical protein Tco_1073929 [Tanacetum coccineum]